MLGFVSAARFLRSQILCRLYKKYFRWDYKLMCMWCVWVCVCARAHLFGILCNIRNNPSSTWNVFCFVVFPATRRFCPWGQQSCFALYCYSLWVAHCMLWPTWRHRLRKSIRLEAASHWLLWRVKSTSLKELGKCCFRWWWDQGCNCTIVHWVLKA